MSLECCKDFQEDWSKPGAVYACRIREDDDEPWDLNPIVEEIAKNHGLHVTVMDEKEVILVGCDEGMFRVDIPVDPDGRWEKTRLIDHGVSDMYVTDLDDDDRPEIVTIEPFHGDELVIYKALRNQWQPVAAIRGTGAGAGAFDDPRDRSTGPTTAPGRGWPCEVTTPQEMNVLRLPDTPLLLPPP